MRCQIESVLGVDPPCKNAYQVDKKLFGKSRTYKVWCVDLESLDDLKKLIDDVKQTIMVTGYNDEGLYLLIYDDNLEG